MPSNTLGDVTIAVRALALAASVSSLTMFGQVLNDLVTYENRSVIIDVIALVVFVIGSVLAIVLVDRVRMRYLIWGDILLTLVLFGCGIGAFFGGDNLILEDGAGWGGHSSPNDPSTEENAYIMMLVTIIFHALAGILTFFSKTSRASSKASVVYVCPGHPPAYGQASQGSRPAEPATPQSNQPREPAAAEGAGIETRRSSQHSFVSTSTFDVDLEKEGKAGPDVKYLSKKASAAV